VGGLGTIFLRLPDDFELLTILGRSAKKIAVERFTLNFGKAQPSIS
jgi:hypothetical protein